MYEELIRIPKDRIAVLIGEKGKDKRRIQKQANVTLNIDSKEGAVTISGEDNFQVYLAKNIVKAIARGFSPNSALELLSEDTILEFINIKDFAGKSKNNLSRIKARVIGTKGKARRAIQTLTNTKIVIYGKTIGIIGDIESTIKAKKAIENLLLGSKHGSVYSSLERSKK